jgi:hypothetical protein
MTVDAVEGLAEVVRNWVGGRLAAEHVQAGWHAHAIPLSVDGLEPASAR